MIRINLVVANEDWKFGKFTFTKGKTYASRNSKDGRSVVIYSNEKQWCVVINRTYTNGFSMERRFQEKFTPVGWLYVKNYKTVKEMVG